MCNKDCNQGRRCPARMGQGIDFTELQRRCLSAVEHLGGIVTPKQVAEVIRVRTEVARETLRNLSETGLVVMTKGENRLYTFSATRQHVADGSETLAKSRTIANGSSRGAYDGADLRPPPGMPETRLAAFALPSRLGGRLYYKDGRVETVT